MAKCDICGTAAKFECRDCSKMFCDECGDPGDARCESCLTEEEW